MKKSIIALSVLAAAATAPVKAEPLRLWQHEL